MSLIKKSFSDGVRSISPILLGVVPFSLISGMAAVNAGLPEFHSFIMSIIVFAGAAQLATVQLMGQNAPAFIIIMTGLIINLRFVMYSASIAPHFHGASTPAKAGMAYILTDQAYAVSITRYSKDEKINKIYYYLGAALPMWIIWQIGTVCGIILGAQVPKSWSLDFAIPLTFMVLLVPLLKDKPSVGAALVSGFTALAAHPLPYNLGLVTAAIAGIATGYYLSEKKR